MWELWSQKMLHIYTQEKVLQILKMQPNASLPILILLQAEIEGEYIILCTVRSILWHRLLVKMNYLCKKSLIKEKVLRDLCSKQCWNKLNLKLRFLMSYLHALPGEWHTWLEVQHSDCSGRWCAILDGTISLYRQLNQGRHCWELQIPTRQLALVQFHVAACRSRNGLFGFLTPSPHFKALPWWRKANSVPEIQLSTENESQGLQSLDPQISKNIPHSIAYFLKMSDSSNPYREMKTRSFTVLILSAMKPHRGALQAK